MGIFDEFGDDPFEGIFKEFFGRSPGEMRQRRREAIIRGEEEDRVSDFVETNGKAYLIIELPGFNEKDVVVMVQDGQLEIKAQKQGKEPVQSYLSNKLSQGFHLKKELPKFIDSKKFKHTVRNGVLEIVFESKK